MSTSVCLFCRSDDEVKAAPSSLDPSFGHDTPSAANAIATEAPTMSRTATSTISNETNDVLDLHDHLSHDGNIISKDNGNFPKTQHNHTDSFNEKNSNTNSNASNDFKYMVKSQEHFHNDDIAASSTATPTVSTATTTINTTNLLTSTTPISMSTPTVMPTAIAASKNTAQSIPVEDQLEGTQGTTPQPPASLDPETNGHTTQHRSCTRMQHNQA